MSFGDFLGAVAGSTISGFFGQNAADKQMDFQRRMSGTAHQREVADLRAAGLNPVLSATGQGSSSPQGAQPNIPDYSDAFATGADVAMKRATEKNLKEQTKKIMAETAATAADARRIGALADKEEITKLPYTMLRDYLLPKVKSTAEDVATEMKKSGISIKMGKGDFQ